MTDRKLRILFLSAFYPPYVVGGWEQLAKDINQHLQLRGHTTRVLTSDYGVGQTPFQREDVKRLLSLESDLVNYKMLDFFFRHQKRLEHNLEIVAHAIQEFNPDVVFVHVMWNLSRGIAWKAEQLMPGRVVYYIANDWPYSPNVHRAFWGQPARRPGRRLFKKLLAPLALRRVEREEEAFPLKFEQVLTVSKAVKNNLERHSAIPAENMRVVYNGVEVNRFVPQKPSERYGPDLLTLYAGSLVPHKGVHTAVQAISHLKKTYRSGKITLTIVGSGHPDYEAELKRMVTERKLEDRVFFWPRVSREEMPALLGKFDVLVFPSIWEEPLARMMLEAMASGLAVVGTPTGGTPEILQDEQTGLIFQPEDAARLAQQLERLALDASLRNRLVDQARKVVFEKFGLDRMVDEIESALEKVVFSSKETDLPVYRFDSDPVRADSA